MSGLIDPDEKEIAPSVSTGAASRAELYRRRELVAEIVKRFDKESVWDAVQSRDLPPQLIDYVVERLEKGVDHAFIRKELGILRNTDKSWRKIMSALKQGVRIDGTAWLLQQARKYTAISEKLHEQIMKAFEDGVPVYNEAKEEYERVFAPTKELSMTIDAYNRLQQGFAKLGKDLGAFVETESGKPAGGVTIVVQNNVRLPDQKEIDANREKEMAKAQTLIIEAQRAHEVRKPQT